MAVPMKNTARLQAAFARALHLEAEKVVDDLAYGKDWDSVAHMAIVAALESQFGIMLETTDVVDMSTVQKAKSILTKYGIVFEP